MASTKLTHVHQRPRWLPEREFPFTSRVVEIDGNRVHYVDEGRGPTLLFVHATLWSFVWRDVIVALRDRFRCIALDFPGAGLSEAVPSFHPSVRGNTEILERFVRELGLQRYSLVLHDLGGPSGLELAARESGRVEGLVIASTFGWPVSEYPHVAKMLRRVGGRIGRFLNAHLNVMARVSSTRFGGGRHLSRAGKRAFRGPFRSRAARDATISTLRSALDIDEEMRRLGAALAGPLRNLPVLTIWGARNPAERTIRWQERWGQMFPSARAVTFEKGHHFPMMDEPQRFAEAVREWHRSEVARRRSA